MNRLPVHPMIMEVAHEFWQPLDFYKSYPVDIERVVTLSSLPVVIVLLPNLTIEVVQKWVVESGLPIKIPTEDKSLHGFLLAYKGQGIIFINGTDPPEERRFSLAHEVAHFLLDYQLPRRRFIDNFGDSVLPILDGERPPNLTERLRFITTDLPSPFTIHHLDNRSLTLHDSHLIWKAEGRTDALALELLAPYGEVLNRISSQHVSDFGDCLKRASKILSNDFGLPKSIVQYYAVHIARHNAGEDTTAKQWGLV